MKWTSLGAALVGGITLAATLAPASAHTFTPTISRPTITTPGPAGKGPTNVFIVKGKQVTGSGGGSGSGPGGGGGGGGGGSGGGSGSGSGLRR
jgi:hypothetical protein